LTQGNKGRSFENGRERLKPRMRWAIGERMCRSLGDGKHLGLLRRKYARLVGVEWANQR
jgi:hypothetical protein